MNLFNDTPFVGFVFDSLDEEDNAIHVVVCRGTFDLAGGELKVASTQTPIVLSDVYHGDPLRSSLLVESDLVPTKLAADITVRAKAVSPGRRPTDSWPVILTVGAARKELMVCGPSTWRYSLLRGWKLSPPEPCIEVPIEYELAFGGCHRTADGESVDERNPAGVGFVCLEKVSRDMIYVAPQVVATGTPLLEFGEIHEPAGFGAIAKHWLPRRRLCGTADDNWKQHRWPYRPKDFSFGYYNCASPGLVIPGYLNGREHVRLEGVSPARAVVFDLPGIELSVLTMCNESKLELKRMTLDTLHIDTFAMQVILVWRLAVHMTAGLQMVQIVPENSGQDSV